ncbi:hypothetical protein [Streptomyces sp. KL116D]|uniref:hypothetical protein n=1 Tax=Streptomyces sp. KL116D TaxID=3045152 RepID=UPI003557F90C
MTGSQGARRVLLPVVGAVALVLLVMAVAHGVHRPEGAGDAYRRAHPAPTAVSSRARPEGLPLSRRGPVALADRLPVPDGATAQPGDHYAENHGFRVPFALHGQRRCDGLAAVRRVEHALRPLRERGDFTAKSAASGRWSRSQLPDGGVRAQRDSAGVYFPRHRRPDATVRGGRPVPGGPAGRRAFGSYPDHVGCDLPSGGPLTAGRHRTSVPGQAPGSARPRR